MYKIEKSQENDGEFGILWTDIKVSDENENYIIFRNYKYNHKDKWQMFQGLILNTKFYKNDKYGFTKMGKGKIKKEVEQKQTEMLEWTFENVQEINVNNIW